MYTTPHFTRTPQPTLEFVHTSGRDHFEEMITGVRRTNLFNVVQVDEAKLIIVPNDVVWEEDEETFLPSFDHAFGTFLLQKASKLEEERVNNHSNTCLSVEQQQCASQTKHLGAIGGTRRNVTNHEKTTHSTRHNQDVENSGPPTARYTR
jgi:hypothetical protein